MKTDMPNKKMKVKKTKKKNAYDIDEGLRDDGSTGSDLLVTM